MTDSAKVCPSCRCEYLPQFEICADCNVSLVHPADLSREPAPDELPPASEMVPVRIASISFIRGLSEMLQAADIPHRIDEPPLGDDRAESQRARRQSHDLGVAVYVLPSDVQAAANIDEEFMRREVPDQQRESDQAADEQCPACGEPLAVSAEECGSCGLPFLDVE